MAVVLKRNRFASSDTVTLGLSFIDCNNGRTGFTQPVLDSPRGGSPQVRRIRAEGQHQPCHPEVIGRRINPVLPAFAVDLLDTAPPGLDIACSEERIGDQRIEGLGRMFAQQFFQRAVLRQITGVPKHELVFIHADLDGHASE